MPIGLKAIEYLKQIAEAGGEQKRREIGQPELSTMLIRLVDAGYLVRIPAEDYRDDVFRITDSGKEFGGTADTTPDGSSTDGK